MGGDCIGKPNQPIRLYPPLVLCCYTCVHAAPSKPPPPPSPAGVGPLLLARVQEHVAVGAYAKPGGAGRRRLVAAAYTSSPCLPRTSNCVLVRACFFDCKMPRCGNGGVSHVPHVSHVSHTSRVVLYVFHISHVSHVSHASHIHPSHVFHVSHDFHASHVSYVSHGPHIPLDSHVPHVPHVSHVPHAFLFCRCILLLWAITSSCAAMRRRRYEQQK